MFLRPQPINAHLARAIRPTAAAPTSTSTPPRTSATAAALCGLLISAWFASILLSGCNLAPRYWDIPKDQRAELDRIQALPDAQAAQERARFASAHPEWSEQERLAIAAGEITQRMDALQVYAAWGKPIRGSRINSFLGPPDIETWVYSDTTPQLQADFFEARLSGPYYFDTRHPNDVRHPPTGQYGFKKVLPEADRQAR
jgi:hypothetical protein